MQEELSIDSVFPPLESRSSSNDRTDAQASSSTPARPTILFDVPKIGSKFVVPKELSSALSWEMFQFNIAKVLDVSIQLIDTEGFLAWRFAHEGACQPSRLLASEEDYSAMVQSFLSELATDKKKPVSKRRKNGIRIRLAVPTPKQIGKMVSRTHA
jgi:hypothetical protein